MYLPDKNIAILTIPKNGTHTFVNTFHKMYPNTHQVCGYHDRASRVLQMVSKHFGSDAVKKCKIFALIREPESRFLSALNYRWEEVLIKEIEAVKRIGNDQTLEGLINTSFTNWPEEEDFMFNPQTSWLDCNPSRISLFLTHKELLSEAGYNGDIVKYNVSKKYFTIKDLQESKYYDIIKERYHADYSMYDTLNLMTKSTALRKDHSDG